MLIIQKNDFFYRIAICYIHHLRKTLKHADECDYEYERSFSPAPLPKSVFRPTITNQWPKIPTEFNLYHESNQYHYD